MTTEERNHHGLTPYDQQQAEWTTYLAQPIEVRQAIQEKVNATLRAQGVQAGRDMMRALGMPTPPDWLCLPADVVEARQEGEDDDDASGPVPNRMDH